MNTVPVYYHQHGSRITFSLRRKGSAGKCGEYRRPYDSENGIYKSYFVYDARRNTPQPSFDWRLSNEPRG